MEKNSNIVFCIHINSGLVGQLEWLYKVLRCQNGLDNIPDRFGGRVDLEVGKHGYIEDFRRFLYHKYQVRREPPPFSNHSINEILNLVGTFLVQTALER